MAVWWKIVNAAALLDVRTASRHLPTMLAHFNVIIDYQANSFAAWQPTQPANQQTAQETAEAEAAAGGGTAGVLADLLVKTAAAGAAAASLLYDDVAKSNIVKEMSTYLTAVSAASANLSDSARLALDPLDWWRNN